MEKNNTKKLLFKQDINFVEYPLWFQNVRTDENHIGGYIWRDVEGYEYRAAYKPPTKTDWLFLLFMMSESQTNNWNRNISMTRYKILKKCGITPGRVWYQRLEDSLDRWMNVTVEFYGSFYNGKTYETLKFGIINGWGINEKTKKLEIKLDEDWSLKIQNSVYYKLIDFSLVRKLKAPLAIRLYEILLKSFHGRSTWKVNAVKLAQKIPMKEKYASDIAIKIGPAVKRIRKETPLNVYLELDKKQRGEIILIFRLKDEPKEEISENKSQIPQKPSIVVNEKDQERLKSLLKLIPSEHAKSLEEIVYENLKNKGVEYVRKAIEYTNSKQPDDYPAYLASVLRKDYAANHDPDKAKYSEVRQKALKCFTGCNGSCASEWKRYSENKGHECHWCKKFDTQRLKVN